MYKIKPENVKAFITDRNIKLPRFQRKQTWDEKKNFQLCISVFKQFPIGVCILSREAGNKNIRSLLDGRQRRNALDLMFKDPENIYLWAKKFIGFKNQDQPSDLKEKFKNKIEEYLESDSVDAEFESVEMNQPDLDEYNGSVDDQSMLFNEEEVSYHSDGLDFLLEIILIIHNKNSKGSGFTRPFYFGNSVIDLPYLDGGVDRLSSAKLKIFIDEYRQYCDSNDFPYDEWENFYMFLNSRRLVNQPENLKRLLRTHWTELLERINILNRIETLLTSCEIGVIEIENISAPDSQKIFEIINSGGSKLSAVEILSAKPSWNKKIENTSADLESAVKSLYSRMGIPTPKDIVRWDLPATLLRRVEFKMALKHYSSENGSDFAKELTIGFQIMAGIYEKAITKKAIENLSKNDHINWNSHYETLVQDLNTMIRLISDFSYFKFLNSWRTSIQELTTDGCALNFILVAYKSWIKAGKPIGANTSSKKFVKNCFILWDRLVFEYVNGMWAGTMDAKITKYLNRVEQNEDDVFQPIPEDSWKRLLTEILEKSKIGDVDLKFDLMKPLLYHFYCLSHISGPDNNDLIEIDHILPKTKFDQSSLPQKDTLKHNLFNLGLLPKRENISKSDKTLTAIDDEWLKLQIHEYEQIPSDKFQLFSNINNYKDLFELRKTHFDKAYGQMRHDLINN